MQFSCRKEDFESVATEGKAPRAHASERASERESPRRSREARRNSAEQNDDAVVETRESLEAHARKERDERERSRTEAMMTTRALALSLVFASLATLVATDVGEDDLRKVRRLLQQQQQQLARNGFASLFNPRLPQQPSAFEVADESFQYGSAMPCSNVEMLSMESRHDTSLPQLQYVKVLIENTGNQPVNLDGLSIPFPYREVGGAKHDLIASCTNAIVLGATMTNTRDTDLCSHMNITVLPSSSTFLVEFSDFALCPHCKIDGFSDALSLFAVYDEHWQKIEIDVTMSVATCVSGAQALHPKEPKRADSLTLLEVDSVQKNPGQCHTVLNAQYGGTTLSKPDLKTTTATECCDLCHKEPNCNVWSWCDGALSSCPQGEGNKCALKFEKDTEPQVVSTGRYTPWSSGYLGLTQDTPQPAAPQRQANSEAARATCPSEISALAQVCREDLALSAPSIVPQCCQEIYNLDATCLCSRDFGYETSVAQDGLQSFALRQCRQRDRCAGVAGAAQGNGALPKSMTGPSPLQRQTVPSVAAMAGGLHSPPPSLSQPPLEDCGKENVKIDLLMESNGNYNEISLVGSLTNISPRTITLGEFTIPIFFSRGARGADGEWHRADPSKFVIECKEPFVSSSQESGQTQRPVTCDAVRVEVDEEGILFTPYGVTLCPGCSLRGSGSHPIWQIRHVDNYPLDFIHLNPALASNGPIIGKPICNDYRELEMAEASRIEISDEVLREASDVNTAQDLLLGYSDPKAASGRPEMVEPKNAQALSFDDMSRGDLRGDRLSLVSPGQAAAMLQQVYPAQAAEALAGTIPENAVAILQAMSPTDAAKIMDAMQGTEIAGILRYMTPIAASQLLGRISPVVAASALQLMPPQEAQSILRLIDPQQATQIQNALPPASASPSQLAMMPPAQSAAVLRQLYPTQAAAALRGMDDQNQAAGILDVMPVEDAAAITDTMPGGAVADLVGSMQVPTGQQLLGAMSPVVRADALRQMPPQKANELMRPPTYLEMQQGAGVQDAVNFAMPSVAENVVAPSSLPPQQASDPALAAQTLSGMSPTEIAGILRYMTPTSASQLLGRMSPVVAASALQLMPPQEAESLLRLVDPQQATQIQNAIPPASLSPENLRMAEETKAAALLSEIFPAQAAAALMGLEDESKVERILKKMRREDAEAIAAAMPPSIPDKRAQAFAETPAPDAAQALPLTDPVVDGSEEVIVDAIAIERDVSEVRVEAQVNVVVTFSPWVKVGNIWTKSQPADFLVKSSNGAGSGTISEENDQLMLVLPPGFDAVTLRHKDALELDWRAPASVGPSDLNITLVDKARTWLIENNANGGLATAAGVGGGLDVSAEDAARILRDLTDEQLRDVLQALPAEALQALLDGRGEPKPVKTLQIEWSPWIKPKDETTWVKAQAGDFVLSCLGSGCAANTAVETVEREGGIVANVTSEASDLHLTTRSADAELDPRPPLVRGATASSDLIDNSTSWKITLD